MAGTSSAMTTHWSNLIRFEPFGLDHGLGSRLTQEIDHRAAALGVTRGGRHKSGKLRDALYGLRQRPDDVDLGHRHQLGHLLNTDLRLAARDNETDQAGRA